MTKLQEKILNEEERKRDQVRRAVRKLASTVAACLCILIGLPTLAANVEPLYKLMRQVSPELAQSFRLVQKTDENLGIRMEVVSVYLQDNELQAYITLEDLEGNRINKSTDLSNSYSVNMPYPSYGGGGWKPVDFDEETGKATFLITLGLLPDSEDSHQKIAGKKITLFLRQIVSSKTEYDALKIEIPWSEVQKDPETVTMRMNSGPAPNIIKGDAEDPRPLVRMLKPGAPDSRLAVDGILLTGMGYVDGMLHIQTAVRDHLKNDNHCELFLIDRAGNRRYYDYKVTASGDTEETAGTMYQDCIFEISLAELKDYTLHGHFVTGGTYLEGNWSVTFQAEEQVPE